MSGVRRWVRFNAVGAAGFVVQFLTLGALAHGLGMHYLVATLLAVEAAVLHNFAWHEKWTWADRPSESMRDLARRLLQFHVANGLTSLAGNLVLMKALVGLWHWPLLPANMVAVAACSIINFLLSHYMVFRPAAISSVSPSAARPRSPASPSAGLRRALPDHHRPAGRG